MLDELIFMLLIIMLFIMLLGWVIIVDGLIIAPSVTVVVIVHGADDTALTTGMSMHVEVIIVPEDIIVPEGIICALASEAAARAAVIEVILAIFVECTAKMLLRVRI
jgi:hypothetical protein